MSAFCLQQLKMNIRGDDPLKYVSLLSYNPYHVLDVDTARDDGVASPLQVRTMQVHALVLQLAVVLAELAITSGRRLHAVGGPEAATPMRRQLGLTVQQGEALNHLNQKRELHCTSDLEWDDSLADQAQKYANTCPTDFSDGAKASRHLRADLGYGETLAFGFGRVRAAQAVQDWYDERSNYAYFGGEPDMDELRANLADNVWGQFTQVVWGASTKVGCAYNNKCNGNPTVWVCRFHPAGNRDSSFAANVLETACSPPPSTPPPALPVTRATAEDVEEMGHVAYYALAERLNESSILDVTTQDGLRTLLETAALEIAGDSKLSGQYKDLPEAVKVSLFRAMQNSFELLENQLDQKHGELEQWQLQVVDELNLKRAPHCAPNLEWDADLATAAQTYLSTYLSPEDPGGCSTEGFRHSDSFNADIAKSLGIDGYGETLSENDASDFIHSAVVRWYDYQQGKYTGVYNEGVADYMQVMWAAYDRIGCGKVSCPTGRRVVCRYQSSAGGGAANLSDADAVRTNIRTETQPLCMSNPTPSRRQLARNAASKAAFVAAGYVANQMARLAAGVIDASDLDDATDAGGNIGLLVKLLTTHSNPNMIMRYLPRDARELIRSYIAAERAELGIRINEYHSPLVGWMHMALGHLKRKEPQDKEEKDTALLDASVENDTCPLAVPIDTPAGLPPTPEGQTPMLPTEEVPKAGAVQAAPQRDGDYSEYSDAGGNAAMVDESEQDRQRRIEWIKYYVRTGEPDKAYELGWDGLPFQIAVQPTGAQTDLTRI